MKIKYILFTLCLLGILSLNLVLVNAWSNNTFNNSLTMENLTFSGNSNITRYLATPASSFSNATLTLDSFSNMTWSSSPTSCSFDACSGYGNDTDASLTSYSQTCNTQRTTTENITIMNGTTTLNWTTHFEYSQVLGGNGNITIFCFNYSSSNYNVIYNYYNNTDGTVSLNLNTSIPNNCFWNRSEVKIKTIYGEEGGGGICSGHYAVTDYYEGYLYGYPDYTPFPINPYIKIGSSTAWSGNFLTNSTINVANFKDSLNSYTSTCSFIGGYCYIPFIFHSDSYATLRYSNLNFLTQDVPLENSQTFNSTTYQSKSEDFILNMTYDSSYYSSVSASLIYNGTSYLGTKIGSGNTVLFKRTLSIPSITGNQTFYWNIALTNTTTTNYYNSTFNNQTVNNIVFARCNATYSTPILVNYTIKDEELTNVFIPATMKATFYYSLDTSYSKTYSLTTEANTTFQFCSNYNGTFNVKANIQLNNDSYIQRTYNLIENYTNSTTQKDLFMLSGTNGTNIILEVKDSGNQPLPYYFIDIYRYYPETNSFTMIYNKQTDIYGQTSARLIENTVKYKFIFKDSNGTTVKTSDSVYVNCRATICVLPFIIEDDTDFFSEFENATSYDWSFTFNNNTNIFTFSWNDVSGVSAVNRLYVERFAVNGTSVICNSTSAASSGSITCSVGSSSSSYQAQVFRKIGSNAEVRIGTLSIKVGHEARDIFGKEGLIWCFLLFMTLISMGIYKPSIGITLYLLGVVVLGFVIPITYLTGGLLIAQFVIGCIFIWAFKG